MSNLIQLHRGSKSFGAKMLFSEAGFSIGEGEHVGVIGPNGAGKTTLFKVLVGSQELDSGEISRARGLRLGYLAQHDEWAADETVEQYLSRDCHMPIWDLKSLGRGLGLAEEIYARPIASLSGGYRMRCKLLHLLGEEPDLLLLDEPTNYLDLESLLALERFLQGYRRAFLLISHDREFLRRTTDHILEVEGGDITKYNGSLDDYFEQKELLQAQLAARALSIEDKRREILDFVARFGAKATKASQAQSRLKSLDRLEKIEIRAAPTTATIRLPEPTPTGKLIVQARELELGYGDNTVLREVSFGLSRGDHLGVVGVNGAGKSTLLKALAGRIEPLRGEIERGHQASFGYYAQHVSESLDHAHTVFEALSAQAHPSVTRQQILDLAGSLLFSGDDVRKRIAVLSGGERSRVALGQILLKKAPCLLLDEPTNHLDFQTVEALTRALAAYAGGVVVVSHDRGFMSRVASRILEIRDRRAAYYPGTYDEYVWSCQRGSLASREPKPPQASTRKPAPELASEQSGKKFNYKEEKKTLERELRKAEREQGELEAAIEKGQSQMRALNEKLSCGPAHPDAGGWINELARVTADVNAAEARWLELVERREELRGLIEAL